MVVAVAAASRLNELHQVGSMQLCALMEGNLQPRGLWGLLWFCLLCRWETPRLMAELNRPGGFEGMQFELYSLALVLVLGICISKQKLP